MDVVGRDDKLLEFDSLVEGDASSWTRVVLQDEADELGVEIVDELRVDDQLAQHNLDELLEEELRPQSVRPVDQPPEEDKPTEEGADILAGRNLTTLVVL